MNTFFLLLLHSVMSDHDGSFKCGVRIDKRLRQICSESEKAQRYRCEYQYLTSSP